MNCINDVQYMITNILFMQFMQTMYKYYKYGNKAPETMRAGSCCVALSQDCKTEPNTVLTAALPITI